MKLPAALAKSLLMAASIGMVVPLTLRAAAPGTRSGATRQTGQAPKAGAKTEEAPAPENAEQEAQIPGTVMQRANGGFISLVVDDGKFRLRFYDDKKKPVKPDVARASARWRPKGTVGDERTILNPDDDGVSLRGAVYVRPPLVFNVFLTLLSEDDSVAEHFVIPLRN